METQFANIFTDRLNVPVVSPCCPFSAAANGAISLSSISPPHNGSKHFLITKKVFPNISQKLYHYSQKGASPPKNKTPRRFCRGR